MLLIKDAIKCAGEHDCDIVLCEIGGVSGDIESLPFLEAARQFRFEHGYDNTCFVHLTLVPYLKAAGELKTKPSQHSVGMLRNIGIIPDILVCRTEMTIPKEHLEKLALFCNVRPECVIEEKDVTDSVYAIPRELRKQGLDEQVLKQLHLDIWPIKHTVWDTLVKKATQPKKECTIALVGKYIAIRDAYKSVHEALHHAGMAHNCKVNVKCVEAEELEGNPRLLKGVDGILVPGGFGSRGVDGKIVAIKYAREHKVPFLGICLGMQCTAIEYARNVVGWKDANSTEFDEKTAHPVIDLMADQKGVTQKGGTMRLGAYPCVIEPGTLAAKLYKSTKISERHRHRYELSYDSEGRRALEKAGLKVSGTSPDGRLVEIVELPGHPYFIAGQFHHLMRPSGQRTQHTRRIRLILRFAEDGVTHHDGVRRNHQRLRMALCDRLRLAPCEVADRLLGRHLRIHALIDVRRLYRKRRHQTLQQLLPPRRLGRQNHFSHKIHTLFLKPIRLLD